MAEISTCHIPHVPDVSFGNRPVESKIDALLFGYLTWEPPRRSERINRIARCKLQENKGERGNGEDDGYAL
jgi:hypothetical protein